MDFFNKIKNNIILFISSIALNVLLLLIMLFIIYNNKSYSNNTISESIKTDSLAMEEEIVDNYTVEVKGAVKKTGVYTLSSDSIINDLINLSGGFNKDAYTNNINLSKKITNEMVLYVFTKKEYNKQKESNVKTIEKVVYESVPCECKTADISNCIDNNQSIIIASDKDTVFEEAKIDNETSKLININTASVDLLISLPGIGVSKANDIINYRNNNGIFNTIDDIKKVNGIGNALFEKIKDLITV